MLVVIFWRTTLQGSKEDGRVVLSEFGVTGAEEDIALLFPDGVPEKKRDIRAIMRDAPRRFSGGYLRAEVRKA